MNLRPDRMHCFELRTANVDYYIGEDPNFGQKENGNAASALPQALETGLGVHLAKSWETAIRQALLPLTNNSQGAAASPSPPSKWILLAILGTTLLTNDCLQNRLSGTAMAIENRKSARISGNSIKSSPTRYLDPASLALSTEVRDR